MRFVARAYENCLAKKHFCNVRRNFKEITHTIVWDIPWYNTRKLCITILYLAIENT